MISIKVLLPLIITGSVYFGGDAPIRPDSPEDVDRVYVLHGFGRTKFSMILLAARLEDAGFAVTRIGYPSINKTPEEILLAVSEQINATLPKQGQTIHFVGHSLGGLMIRAYLDGNKIEALGRVVLLGTPNQGTTLVDKYRDDWWMKMLGPMAQALGTDDESFPNSIPPPYYPIGIIAAVTEIIANEKFIPGKDDGLIALESTKLSTMTDFIVLKSNHGMMRYDGDVADQTIEFLINGKFKKE